MKRKAIYILIFPVLALGLYHGYARRTAAPVQPEQAGPAEEMVADQQVLQFDLTAYTDRGTKRWEVKGRSANMVDEMVELKDLSATTYGQDNTLALKAEEGVYDKEQNTVHLEKNVVITTSDGAKVLSDTMDWDGKHNVITTDSIVTIEREEIVLSGRGVKGEPELRKAQFTEDVRIEMDSVDGVGGVGGPTVITCDGILDIDYEKNVAVFNDNVKIVDDKGEITADKLYAYLNPETKTISKAIARGNVRIMRGGNSSTCEEAVYLPEERKVLLTGRPEIVIYPDKEFDAAIFTAPGLGGKKDEPR